MRTATPLDMNEIIDLTDSDSVEEVKLSVSGDPVTQPRPRFHNGGIANMKIKHRKEFILSVQQQLQQIPGHPCPFPIGVPVELRIDFYIRRPRCSI